MTHKILSITEAKAKYLQLISEVEAGEIILITRRGRPVATIMPYDPKAITA
jgi:prevent-host-death family protein